MPLGGVREVDGIKQIRFTVPYTFHGPMGPVKSPDGPGNHGMVRIPKWGLVVRDEHWENRREVVEMLLTDRVLKSDPADAVVAGIMTLEEVQAMGFLHDKEEMKALNERLGIKEEPEEPAPVKPEIKKHSLPELPNFSTMRRKEIIEWANEEGEEYDDARGGQEPFCVNPMYNKERVVEFIMRNLKKRGDPRAE